MKSTVDAPPDFNFLARCYRWMELATLGPWLQRCRCAYLPLLAEHRSALILGDGDGRFTLRLLRTNSSIGVDAVDASPAMLAALLRRARAYSARVRTHLADIRRGLPPGPRYDLIVSHFFLDCLTTAEVESLASTLRAVACPGASWLISEFHIPDNGYGRFVARPLVFLLYRAFALLTGLSVRELPDHRAALSTAGFSLRQKRAWLGGLLVSELWTLPENSDPERAEGSPAASAGAIS